MTTGQPRHASPLIRRAFAALAVLQFLIVLAQFYLAATGAFAKSDDEAFEPHKALGYVTFVVPVVMAIVAAAGRLPGRLTGLSALVAGLVTVQVIVAKIAESLGDDGAAGPLLFGLHALVALVIAAVAGDLGRRSRDLWRSDQGAAYNITHG